ncbi:MAG: hypothetical protein IPN11_05460 [Opitutaceae bacterium]|nr:hypothetical protein [Opitutaceae bacterium]
MKPVPRAGPLLLEAMQSFFRQGRFLVCTFAACALLLGGCVSAKYKTIEKKTSPVSLNLTGEKSPVAVSVQSVIVYRGPGSWKRDAYWDEYIVALANQGETPVTLESVTLTDFTGTASPPSDNPWALEKQSRDREEELRANVKDVLLQIGGGYVIMSVAVTGGLAVAGFAGGVLAMPAFVAGTIYANVHQRHLVEGQFAKRRIVLPATIPPGQAAQGSLFFRISPGPRQLAFLIQYDGGYRKVVVDLAPLAGLHFKPKEKPAAPAGK